MPTEDHSAIHKVYCTLTDRDMPCTMSMHLAWNAWKAYGGTEADLRLVVAHIKKLIKLDRRRPESLRFYNLISDHERWVEDLAEARACARTPRRDPARDSILSATGRKEQHGAEARPVRGIIAAEKAFEKFREEMKRL